jgi:hypothetical protein
MSELKVEKINLGTSLSSENPNAAIHITRDNNTSTIVIEENIDGTGGGDIRFWKTREGAALETGDNLGLIMFYSDKGDTNVATIYAATDASGDDSGLLRFKTKESGGSIAARMTIKEDGSVGIGDTDPDLRFVASHSRGSGTDNVCFRMENTNSAVGSDVLMLKLGVSSASSTVNNMYIVFHASDGRIGRIAADGSGGIDIQNAFTGGHPTVIPADAVGELGMIVESTGNIWAKSSISKGVSTGIPKVQLTTSSESKKVYGVVSETYTGENEEYGYAGYVRNWGVAENEAHIKVNSLGEGLVWITNKNGEIQNGDFICSTDIPGYGGKQSDDLLHNYTVAKCVETIDWNSISDTIDHNDVTYKKYLVACTYHCG